MDKRLILNGLDRSGVIKVKSKKVKKIVLIIVSFMLISIMYTILALHYGYIYPGHDRSFHLERLEEAYRNVSSNNFFISVINTFSFSKTGQAVNVYYPWGNLLPYTLIRIFVNNPVKAYYFYMELAQFLGLSVAYLSAKSLTKSTNKSFIFAVLTRLSTVIIFDDYIRADIGESWALIFVPLAFAGLYFLLNTTNYKLGILMISLGLSLEFYCHIMTSFLSVIVILALVILWLICGQNICNRLVIILKYGFPSALIFLGSTIAIWLPMITFRGDTKIFLPDKTHFASNQVDFNSVINASIGNNLTIVNIGIVGIIVLVICLVNIAKFSYINKKIFIFGIVLLLFSTSIFPWYLFRNTAIATIQFGWRFMSFAMILLTFVFVDEFNFNGWQVFWITMFTIICVNGAIVSFIQKQNCYPNYTQESYKNAYKYNLDAKMYKKIMTYHYCAEGSSYYADYLPDKLSLVQLDNHLALINNKKTYIQTKNIIPIYQGEIYRFKKNDVYSVRLPFVIYKKENYVVMVNGKKSKFKVTDKHLLCISKPYSIKNIKVIYITPNSYIIARWVSLAIVLTCVSILIACYGIRKKDY